MKIKNRNSHGVSGDEDKALEQTGDLGKSFTDQHLDSSGLKSPPGLILLDNPNAYDTHGLDCLFTLIRHIYSQLMDAYFDKNNQKDAEMKNPILALAWLDINFEVKDEWARCKQGILEGFGPSHAQDPVISFEGLVNSQLMKDTFWNHEMHKLYRAYLVKPDNGRWGHADLGPNPDAVKVDMSEILVDRNKAPWWSFNQHMRSNFQLIKTDNTTELKMCAGPGIIRVHYKTNKNMKPFPFSDLKNTHIPIAGVKGSEPSPNDKDCLYTLIAAVSLKDNGIRTYMFLGHQILAFPGHDASEKKWSLEDKVDGDYMLFYRRADDAVPDFGIPEVVVLPLESPNVAVVNDALQRDIDDRRKAKRIQREKEERDREQDS
ncbi:X-pro dipeptidyl-peptidase [Fusarium mundagurra]|uniref:X-pro dipeptidyl-peptidase n=1 Tax=Fusarium mundagurra TaxID=1567541 RepID=A0A8H6CYX0_9HYPO|nr:X-pro dipeptidyl-peptidase [Fusarium mundagurra]